MPLLRIYLVPLLAAGKFMIPSSVVGLVYLNTDEVVAAYAKNALVLLSLISIL